MLRFRLKEVAKERGFTQESLARKADVGTHAVRMIWQHRTLDPRVSTVVAMSRALGVPMEELFEETDLSENEKTPTPS